MGIHPRQPQAGLRITAWKPHKRNCLSHPRSPTSLIAYHIRKCKRTRQTPLMSHKLGCVSRTKMQEDAYHNKKVTQAGLLITPSKSHMLDPTRLQITGPMQAT